MSPRRTGRGGPADAAIDGDANGYVLTLCGARDARQVDGHPGYDWRMPEGTPLLAVGDAVVLTAGLEPPHPLTYRSLRLAPTGDPWEIDSRGAASVWLWKDGAAPSLR